MKKLAITSACLSLCFSIMTVTVPTVSAIKSTDYDFQTGDTSNVEYVKYSVAVNPTITSVTPGNQCVNVKWNAVSGAAGYRVFYKVSGGNWTSIKVSKSTTSYNVTGLKNGTKYAFLVKAAVNGQWTVATSKDVVTATPLNAVNPTITSVTPGNQCVNVKWGAVSGATGYRVFYKVSGGKWTSIKVSKSTTSYTVTGLKNGTKYEFLVKAAVSGQWTVATSKDVVTATPLNAVNPTITSVTPGNQCVNVKWEAVSGAAGYRVFYKISGGEWTSVKVSKSTTSYTVTGLKNGTKYEFLVKAAVNGQWTVATKKYIVYATPVSAVNPTITSVTPGNECVNVKWGAVSGATGYKVFYKISGEAWNSVKVSKSTTSYTVTGLKNGTKYEFLVKAAINGQWTVATKNDIVFATPCYEETQETYSISGYVWLEEPAGKNSTFNDIRDSSEDGVNDFQVRLNGNGIDKTVKTATIDGVSGFYKFDDLAKGNYTVYFTYNGIRYGNNVMTDNENNLIAFQNSSRLSDFSVRSTGTYVNNNLVSDAVSSIDAFNDSVFDSTSSHIVTIDKNTTINYGLKYRSTADLGLYYDIQKATLNDTNEILYDKRASNGETFSINASEGDNIKLEYKVRLINQSSISTNATKIAVYVPTFAKNISINNLQYFNPSDVVTIYGNTYYRCVYETSQKLGNNESEYITVSYSFLFDNQENNKFISLAEIIEYSFIGGYYDIDSIPDNLTSRNESDKMEDDESKSPIFIGESSETYSISGYVWLEEPAGKNSTVNNIRDSYEEGVNDFPVRLTGNGYDTAITTSTIDGISGFYKFDNLSKGRYTISFTHNGIQYANNVMTDNENNIISFQQNGGLNDFSVRGNGTYVNSSFISPTASISEARNDKIFDSTSSYIMDIDKNITINYGLNYNDCGDLALYYDIQKAIINGTNEFTYDKRAENGQTFSISTAKGDEIELQYKVRLINQTGISSNHTKIALYIPTLSKNIKINNIQYSNSVDTVQIYGETYYRYIYETTKILGGNEEENIIVSYSFMSDDLTNNQLLSLAEIIEYSFLGGYYDIDSIPDNLTLRNISDKIEDDEAKSPILINVT